MTGSKLRVYIVAFLTAWLTVGIAILNYFNLNDYEEIYFQVVALLTSLGLISTLYLLMHARERFGNKNFLIYLCFLFLLGNYASVFLLLSQFVFVFHLLREQFKV